MKGEFVILPRIETSLNHSEYKIRHYAQDDQGRISKIDGLIGVSFGMPFEIIDRIGYYALAKIQGHMAWAGVGRRTFHRTMYYLLKMTTDNNGNFGFILMDQVEPGSRWRYWRKRLRDEAREQIEVEDESTVCDPPL